MKNLRAKQWLALALALTLWLSALPAGLAEALEAPVAELGELALPGEDEAVEAASIPSDETAAQPAEAEAMPDMAEAPAAPENVETGTEAEPAGEKETEPAGETEAESAGERKTDPAKADETLPAAEGEADPAKADEADPAAAEPTAEPEDVLAAASEGYRLNAETLRLGVKETWSFAVTFNGEAVSGVSYATSASKVVAITQKGVATAKKAGSAVITAKGEGFELSCAVEVVKAPTKVTISDNKAAMGAGETLQLSASIPAGTASAITWKTSKAAVAAVDADGLVTAKAKGTATISAVACNGKKATCKVTVKAAPTAIAFDRDAVSLSVGQTYVPKVAVTGGSDTYALTVEGDAVAIDGNALTARAEGSAAVTASTYNGLRATLAVKVGPAPKSVAFDALKYEIGVKETMTLEPVFDVDTGATLTYRSSNSKIADVSAAGVVTGKKAGSATVTVTTHNGLTASCQVQVFTAPSKVTLSAKTATIGAGDSYPLTATLPANTRSALTWKSSAPGVATVDQAGVVTGVAKGSATITVTTVNNKRATCKVKVTAQPTKLTLSAERLGITRGGTGTLSWTLDTGEGEVAVTVEDDSVVQIKSRTAKKVTLKGLAVGETKVTFATLNGLTAEVVVRVTPVPTYISVPHKTVSLGEGQTYAIQPYTDAGEGVALTYTSSKKSVATVNADGVVTAVKTGTATITVKTSNKLTAKVKVKVTKAPASLSISPASVVLAPYEYVVLDVRQSSGADARVDFTSSNPAVAYVSEDGVVTGILPGTATITASVYTGLTATCQVTVPGATAPAAPAFVNLRTLNANTLEASWTAVSDADGYRVYVGTTADPAAATLYSSYDAGVTSVTLRGMQAGTICHVFVTAYNGDGETAMADAAHALAKTPTRYSGYTVTLNYTGGILMSAGDSKTLTATVSPGGYTGDLIWESGGGAVALAGINGEVCRVNAEYPGEASVSVTLENGMSAAVKIQVLDSEDVSDANFVAVQKAILQNESLLNEDEGGNVIWTMINNRLTASSMSEENAAYIVNTIKSADDLFRSIYVFAMGTYDIVSNAVRDKHGMTVSMSQFLLSDNTLYLTRGSGDAKDYAYTALHESGHAADAAAVMGSNLASESDEGATEAILSDVRQLLLDRMDEAAADVGVSRGSYSADKVADAVLDYRTLQSESAVLANLTANEQKVYRQVISLLASEMNATLPTNNGTMVWDSVEGATNFAVSGRYGHAYMLDMPQYKDLATYYFYDETGEPDIVAEPWAEFYSAKLMQDAATLAVNVAYLPKTCQYFTETLAPAILSALKDLVKVK